MSLRNRITRFSVIPLEEKNGMVKIPYMLINLFKPRIFKLVKIQEIFIVGFFGFFKFWTCKFSFLSSQQHLKCKPVLRLFSWMIIFGEDQLYHLAYSQPFVLAYCSTNPLRKRRDWHRQFNLLFCVLHCSLHLCVTPKAVRLQIALEGRTDNEAQV